MYTTISSGFGFCSHTLKCFAAFSLLLVLQIAFKAVSAPLEYALPKIMVQEEGLGTPHPLGIA